MQTKFIEATQPDPENHPQNWGKFLVGQITPEEFQYKSLVAHTNLMPAIGFWTYNRMWLWVLDLQTKEGAYFQFGPGFDPELVLEKHQIWVCPLYAPFLGWLQQNFKGDLDTLPAHAEVEAPLQLSGHRRKGPQNG